MAELRGVDDFLDVGESLGFSQERLRDGVVAILVSQGLSPRGAWALLGFSKREVVAPRALTKEEEEEKKFEKEWTEAESDSDILDLGPRGEYQGGDMTYGELAKKQAQEREKAADLPPVSSE